MGKVVITGRLPPQSLTWWRPFNGIVMGEAIKGLATVEV